MALKKKPVEWFDQQPNEDREDYIFRVNNPGDYNLDFTVSPTRRAARLKRAEDERKKNWTYTGLPIGIYDHSSQSKNKRKALGGIGAARPSPAVMSKLGKRICIKVCFKVEGKGKGGINHFRTKRVPRSLTSVAK